MKPVEASSDKLPTFAKFDAVSRTLDRRVAAGEITREEANRQLAAYQRRLAIDSGALPAKPTAEDLPRYKEKKAQLIRQVNAGRKTVEKMEQELASLKILLEATGQVDAPAAPAGKAPAVKAPAGRAPGGTAPARRGPDAKNQPAGKKRARGKPVAKPPVSKKPAPAPGPGGAGL
ncbi:hypothetical protein [Planctomycetes bacterium Poly30]|uniref:hypothetical protein n=1 Tax=Saltatorellus ferox TaxID=2528018 RepID=UPI0011A5CD1A